MGTAQVTVERRIAAPAGRVWEALTDIEHSAEVIKGIDRIEMLSEGPFGVGTRWRETRTMLGKEATEEMWVTASEAPERCVIEAESRGVHYTSEFLLTPAGGESTDVRLTFGSRTTEKGGLKGAVMKMLGGLRSKAAAKALAKDLADVAASLESPQPPKS
ncbi:polyketide cyclase/dehydrase [Streptomyces abyssalis]|uniref:Polyketide cyclase/dehydrase n=1 Tax=Streptomyces abyssalis TaxID=933944 RepID=A0A1E7JWH2_9ACTN|nr:SRPBCC family protein [Streptomyces abyssalis]OEU90455.1 polyketide cyclase/dehydrase [Streptomyces abyssalis]OEU95192.1 polyketide cyclase/dehydrase [Streptomyces abyssalis]OEU95929.1 polyketide cyclase/dehydrase [Streptomyces abyssalis]OEU96029.1 polyketide cyclase/dehydrase [Streptomyces abyssalis]